MALTIFMEGGQPAELDLSSAVLGAALPKLVVLSLSKATNYYIFYI